jgi:hypothetical protein
MFNRTVLYILHAFVSTLASIGGIYPLLKPDTHLHEDAFEKELEKLPFKTSDIMVAVTCCNNTIHRDINIHDLLHSLKYQSISLSYITAVFNTPSTLIVNSIEDDIVLSYARNPVVFQKNMAVNYARNCGIRYLAFISDSCAACPDWLSNIFQSLISSGSAIVVGKVTTCKPHTFLGMYHIKWGTFNVKYIDGMIQGYSYNMIIDLDKFKEESELFDTTLPKNTYHHEDIDFCIKYQSLGVSYSRNSLVTKSNGSVLSLISRQIAKTRLLKLMNNRWGVNAFIEDTVVGGIETPVC